MTEFHDSALIRRERDLVATAATEVQGLAISDLASRYLAELVANNPVEATDGEVANDVANYRALWFMAVIAVRATRAAIWVTAAGYEDQAIGYVRLIDELHGRAQKVRADLSGHYAREWLSGRNIGKGAKLAGREMWDMFSGPVHANAKAVFDWLAVERPDGSTGVVLRPERRPEVSNANHVYIAGELRDIAAMLLVAAGRSVEDLAHLTMAVQAAQLEHWGSAE